MKCRYWKIKEGYFRNIFQIMYGFSSDILFVFKYLNLSIILITLKSEFFKDVRGKNIYFKLYYLSGIVGSFSRMGVFVKMFK